MWQYGLVDTFTAVNFIYNAGAQYSAVVIAAMADGNATKLPSMLFEPITGLGVSYQFIKAAQTALTYQQSHYLTKMPNLQFHRTLDL